MRLIKRLFILLIILILLAVGAVYVYFNTSFKSDAAAYASKITGTNVDITAVTLNPLAGSVSIRGLGVGNPSGYKSNNAISLGAIYTSVDLESLLTDKIIINHVTLNGAEIYYELRNGQDNIRKIMNNVKRNSGSSSGDSSKDFVIRNLHVKNSKVVLDAKIFNFSDSKEIEIPDIAMTNVTKANISSKVKQVANKIMNDVAKVAVQEQLNKQINKATDKVKEKINEKVNDKIGDAIGGKLKGLF